MYGFYVMIGQHLFQREMVGLWSGWLWQILKGQVRVLSMSNAYLYAGCGGKRIAEIALWKGVEGGRAGILNGSGFRA